MQDGASNPPAAEQPAPKPAKKPMPMWVRLLVLVVGIIAMISGLSEIFGGPHDVKYGKDDIRYSHDATHADADAVAKALTDQHYFGGDKGGTVVLDKQGDQITLGFVVDPQKVTPEVQTVLHDLAVTVAKSISGKLVAIKLLDPDLNEKQSIGV